MNLTSFSPAGIDTILAVVTAGIVVFAILMIIMTVVFGLSIKQAASKKSGLLSLLLFSLALPLASWKIKEATSSFIRANETISVSRFEKVKIKKGVYLVNFDTSKPSLVYLEYRGNGKEEKARYFLPTGNFEKTTQHSFVVEVGPKGGKAFLVVDGKYYLIEGKPIIFEAEQ